MPAIETVTLAGMRFHTRVGILPHEQVNPQPLEIDLSVRRAADSPGVLDYRDLHAIVQQCVTGSAVRYLEDAARDIVEVVMQRSGVRWVRVALRKPHVSLDGPLQYAEVALEKSVDE
jgi:FolB domain-containing protein